MSKQLLTATWALQLKRLAALFVFGSFLALTACGGGGGGGSSPSTPTTPTTTTYSISGTVSGSVVNGVTLTLSGTSSATTTTDSSGNYSFTGLADGTYTITASSAGNTFTPGSKQVTINGADSNGNNFTATTTSTTHNISGTISGAVTSGVTMTLGGDATATTTTDGSGNYTFSNIPAGNYTVTPASSGYTFSPSSASVSLSSSADSTGNDFTSTANAIPHSISGTVSGDVMAGVTITVTGGGLSSPATATTDSSGNYTVTGLYQGAYTVTPSLSGYTFSPSSSSVSLSSSADSTGNNFTATASTSSTYTISGTVTGPWVGGITMTLGGAGSATAKTAPDGTYSFSGLVAGTYTVTPSLPGYTYSPAAPSISLSANTTQDFTATSAVQSSTISGTLSYAGSKTGGVYVRVYDQNCSGCQPVAATHLPPQGGAFTAIPYEIRGVPAGTYKVKAGFNPMKTGSPNVANPGGAISNVSTIPGTDNPGIDITLTDPSSIPAPTAPTIDSVYPSDQSAILFYTATFDSNGKEIADSYKVDWSADSTFATGVNSKTFTAQGDNDVYVLNGLPNGTLYFRMTAINHATNGTVQESAATVTGPINIAATTGSNTVSGTVSYTGTATGPMIVVVGDSNTGKFYYTTITSPSSPQSYSVSGVPNGSADFLIAIVDNNNNGKIDTGDFANIDSGTPIAVNGNTTGGDITLPGGNSTVYARTDHSFDGTNDSYTIIGGASELVKKPVKLVLFSGPNVAVPYDMEANSRDTRMFLGTTVPAVGDKYKYKVFYSDGTNETMIATVSAVLSTSNMVSGITGYTDGTGGSTPSVPYFSWTAPASPLPSFDYIVSAYGSNASIDWYDSGVASSTPGILYNSDGSANPATLSSGNTIYLQVIARDADGNRATRAISYTVP
ncbi:MAG: carboxypeptidase-like regulatory domain-containing protein [Gammaproteobacteria bacterium]